MEQAGSPHDNLPAPLSTFIGREHEIAEVKQRLAAYRLLTLTGPGGSGKTRLALRVASEQLAEFADGVWLTEFAPLADATLVPQAMASALNIREPPGRAMLDALVDHLRPRQALLVLDNCEHLVAACAQLAVTLLQACPELRLLATSRETLDVPGEAVWIVPSLSLPEPQPWRDPASGQDALQAYEQSEAVRLFVERAAAALPGFKLTAQNGAWVAEVCRRLDGMPLALELAAARVRTLSVQQIVDHLDNRFHLLTTGSRTAPARQQTLEATLDWSYALLSEAEQQALSRLSVFAGGWTLEAAQAVCADDGIEADDVLDLLTQLANKSLVIVEREQGKEARYRMLETIRQYARDRLLALGEMGTVQRQHRDWFMSLAEQAEFELKGPKQSQWLDHLRREHDNLRAALAWSVENDSAVALRLAGALGQFWHMRGYLFSEGIEWLEKALSLANAPGQAAARAKACRWLGLLAYLQGYNAAARSAYEQSLALCRELRDKDGIAESLIHLGDIAAFQGDASAARSFWATARSCLEESLAGLREQGDKWNIARTLNLLGEVARTEGDYHAARLFYEESLTIRRGLGDERGIGATLHNLGFVANYQCDYQRTAAYFEESLPLFQKLGSRLGILCSLEEFAGAVVGTGPPERAARLLGAVEALYEAFHIRLNYVDQIEHDRYVAAARTQLDGVTFAAAWAEGQAMTLEEAIAYALLEPESPLPANDAKEKFGGLTAREREVAALLAQGKSNREIAEALVVGVRTVETYVTRILNKLGFDSRVQIATWAMDKGLASPSQAPQD